MRKALIGSFLGIMGAVTVLIACGGGGTSTFLTAPDVEARLVAVESNVTQLQAEVATQATTIADLQAEVMAQREKIEDHAVSSDTTLSVPADHADINDALAFLDDKIIAPGVTVTISVADGTHVYGSAIRVAHRDGDKIHIVGNTSNPGAVELQFSGHGLIVTNGHALGGFNGFTLTGGGGESHHGVSAEGGAIVNCGPKLETLDFGTGFYVSSGATLHAEGTTASSSSKYGYHAIRGGILHADDSHSTSSGANGYRAGWGSTIQANSLTTSGNGAAPLYAHGKSLIMAENASVTVASGERGVDASGLSYISVSGGTITGGSVALSCQVGGMVDASNVTVSGSADTAEPNFNTLSADGSYILN